MLKPGRFRPPVSAFKAASKQAPSTAGVYLVSTGEEDLYAGAALNLKGRFDVQFKPQRKSAWPKGELEVRLFTTEANSADLIAYQSILVGSRKPRLNCETATAM